MLAANVTVDATGEPFARSNAVFEFDTGRGSVFSSCTPKRKRSRVRKRCGPYVRAGEDMYRCAQVDERNRCAIVCLGHLEASGIAPNRSLDVLANTEGIDVSSTGTIMRS